eukprot:151612-Chlamydomonas_euryale.AAC.1
MYRHASSGGHSTTDAHLGPLGEGVRVSLHAAPHVCERVAARAHPHRLHCKKTDLTRLQREGRGGDRVGWGCLWGHAGSIARG